MYRFKVVGVPYREHVRDTFAVLCNFLRGDRASQLYLFFFFLFVFFFFFLFLFFFLLFSTIYFRTGGKLVFPNDDEIKNLFDKEKTTF